MALHEVTDPQVAALCLLLRGGLNAELEPLTGEPVVEEVYGYPATVPGRVTQGALPALSIYRLAEREVRKTVRHTETLATFRLDYCTPATPLALIEQRWPLLRAVWKQAAELIAAGKHDAVSGGACILREAGIVRFEQNTQSPTVQYLPPPTDEAGYLRFQGVVQLSHRPDIDLSDLPWFTELSARYDLHADGNTTPTQSGIVVDLASATGFGSGFDSGFGAPDNA
jgi:hypothetical protein